ncbi:hypothetical protein [Daejeonia sp. YH14]|uniref:hypothetical protein n=1 Tax=Daejeonia sp. YH14 TaxID=3439042 RepID=UPI003F497724
MKFLIFCSILISNFLFSQIKLTYGNDIEIYFLGKEISQSELLSGKAEYNFKIKNNTSYSLLISKFGFEKQNYVLNNKEVIFPERTFLSGYPAELEKEECYENIFIIKPNSEIEIKNLDIFQINANYKLEPEQKYILVASSNYKPSFAKLNLIGCEKYIKELEEKNYRFTNFSIFAEIPLIK